MWRVLIFLGLVAVAAALSYKNEKNDERYPPCGPGLVRRYDGRCVKPTVNKRFFLYQSPRHTRPRSSTRIAKNPTKNYNYVFLKTPEVRFRENVVVKPAQQQTIIYLLSKGNQNIQREVVQLPLVTERPEVYYVNYNNAEDNLDLPGGIDLQTALNYNVRQGTLIDTRQETDSSSYAKKGELVDKTITGAVETAPIGLETFVRIPEEDLGLTEAEGGAVATDVEEVKEPEPPVDSIFSGSTNLSKDGDSSGPSDELSSIPQFEPSVSSPVIEEEIPLKFPNEEIKFDHPIPDLSLSNGKSMNYESDSSALISSDDIPNSDYHSKDDSINVLSQAVRAASATSDVFDETVANSFGPEGVIFIIDDGSNFDGSGKTTIVSTGVSGLAGSTKGAGADLQTSLQEALSSSISSSSVNVENLDTKLEFEDDAINTNSEPQAKISEDVVDLMKINVEDSGILEISSDSSLINEFENSISDAGEHEISSTASDIKVEDALGTTGSIGDNIDSFNSESGFEFEKAEDSSNDLENGKSSIVETEISTGYKIENPAKPVYFGNIIPIGQPVVSIQDRKSKRASSYSQKSGNPSLSELVSGSGLVNALAS